MSQTYLHTYRKMSLRERVEKQERERENCRYVIFYWLYFFLQKKKYNLNITKILVIFSRFLKKSCAKDGKDLCVVPKTHTVCERPVGLMLYIRLNVWCVLCKRLIHCAKDCKRLMCYTKCVCAMDSCSM